MVRPFSIEGCYTALVTPFRDGVLDPLALARIVDHQIESGIDGLVAVGTTGESATVDAEEHVEVVRQVVRAARGRVPVLAGAGSNSTAEAIALGAAAGRAGAQGLLHVTPYYNRPTQEGLFHHFRAIAAATPLPIVLYNVPARTSCDLLPETVERLAELPNVVAIKEALGSMPRCTELLGRLGARMTVLSGDDATTFPAYALGARGVISVISNLAPREMSQLWRLTQAGQWEQARALHHRLHPLMQLLFLEPNPVPVKAAMALLGRCGPEVRAPLAPCTAALVERLRAELQRVGLR